MTKDVRCPSTATKGLYYEEKNAVEDVMDGRIDQG
jgi:hypothetical protein